MATINLTQLKQEKEAKQASSSFENAPTIVLSNGKGTVEPYRAPQTQQVINPTQVDSNKIANAVADARAQMLSPKLKGTTKPESQNSMLDSIKTNAGYIGEKALKGAPGALASLGYLGGTLVDNAGSTLDYIYDKVGEKNDAVKLINTLADLTDVATKGKITQLRENLDESELLNKTAGTIKNKASDVMDWSKESSYDPNEISTGVQIAGDLVGGISQMVPSIAATVATKNPTVGKVMMSGTAAGNALDEALKDGASYEDALTYAIATGTVEYVLESLGGSLPFLGEGKLATLAKGFVEKNLQGPIGKQIFGLAADALGEGFEEYLSEVIGEYLTDIYTDAKKEDDIITRLMNVHDEALYSALIGGLTGAIMNVPGTVRGLSDNTSQSVEVQTTPAENDPMKAMINENAKAEAKKIVADMGQNATVNDYITNGLRSNHVMIRMEAQRKNTEQILKSAKDTGVDTKIAKRIADVANRTATRVVFKDLTYTFEDTDGKTKTIHPEGMYENGVIYVSPNAINPEWQVYKHELTHHLETTGVYENFKNAIFDLYDSETLNKMRENLRKERTDLIAKYKNDEVTLSLKIDNELAAVLSQDKIFTDKNTIDDLLDINPNVVYEIWEWLKTQVAKFTGQLTEEELKVKKAEQLYRAAIREANKSSVTQSEPQFFAVNSRKKITKQEYSKAKGIFVDNQTYARIVGALDEFKPLNHYEIIELELDDLYAIVYYKDIQHFKISYVYGGEYYDWDDGVSRKSLSRNGSPRNSGVNRKNYHFGDEETADTGNVDGLSGEHQEKGNKSGSTNRQSSSNSASKWRGLSTGLNSSQLEGSTKVESFFDADRNKLTDNQKKFFKNSKVVDENGDLLTVYHASPNAEFYVFDKQKASPESDMGAGFYFSNQETDAESNYSDETGPDIKNKIDRLAEQLEYEDDFEDADYDERYEEAKRRIVTGKTKHEVYLNIKNPVYVGNNQTELLTYDTLQEYADDNNDGEIYEGIEDDFVYNLTEDLYDILDNSGVQTVNGIVYDALLNGGIDMQSLKENLNNAYLEDNEGNLIGNEVARRLAESLGYDGIIDSTVSKKFKGMGLDADTVHYIAFKPNQIKQVTNESPTTSEDIRYSRGLNADLLANPATEKNITQKVVGYNRAQSDTLNKINGGYARGRTSSIMKQIAAEVVNSGGNYSEELRNELLDEIWNTAYTVDDSNLDVYAGVRDYFKNVKMKLTDSAKAEISDYNSWRKSVSNRLHFAKDGRSIDDVYQELQSLYGEVFPDVNSEGEMLEVMADVYDYEKSKRVHLSELGVKKEDFAKDFDDIMEEFKNNILYRSNKKFLDAVARKSLQKSKADMAQRALQAFGDVSDDVKALLEEHESSEGYRTSEDWSTLVPQIKSYGALSKTLSQVLDVVANSNPEVRARLYNAIEKPLYEAKKTYTTRTRKNVSKVYDEVVSRYNIKKGSKESEALMWYGEKTKSLWNKKQGKLETMPYSLDDLKKDMPNTWQNIVEADKVMRQIYDDYVDSLNDVLSMIYPNIEIKAKYELNKLKANIASLVEQKKQLEDMDLVHAKPETLALYSQVLKDLKASRTKMSKITNDINSGDYYANKRVNKRSDYYHHFYELTASDTLQDIFDMNASNNISNALAGKSEFTKPKSKFAGFMQHRGMGKYEADAIASILDYIPKAEYKIAFDPVITEYRDIISNIVKESGEEYDNTEFINWFTNYTNDLAGKTNPIDRVISNAHNGRKYMKALRSLNNFVKGKTIVGNLASATSQFFNMPNGVALLKHRGGLNAVKDVTLGQKDYLQYIGNKVLRKSDSSPINDSVFLSERYLDGIYSKFDTGILDNVNKMRTWLLQVGDQAVSENLWFSAYEQALRLEKSNPIEYADNLVRDAVAGRGVGEIPLTQKSELVKLLAPFQVEVNNTWNLIKSLSGVQLEGSGVKELAKNLLGGDERDYIALLTMFVITYFMNNLKEEITGNRTGMDLVDASFDTYEKMAKEENASTGDWIASAAGRVGGEFLSNMPGGNWWTTAAGLTGYDAEAFFGEADPSRFGTGVTGVQAVVDPLMQFAVGKNVDWQSILTNLTPIGDKQTNRMYKMAEDAGLIPRIDWNRNDGLIINGNVVGKDQEGKKVPFNEIKWEEFFKDTKKGSYNDNNGLKYPIDTSDPINMAKGFAFGTYATKEGKEYINEGYNALSKQTTEKYEDLVKHSAKNYADAKTYYDYFRQKEDNSYSNAELLNQKAMQDAIKQIIEKGPTETDENGVVTSKYEYSDFGTTEKAMKAYAGAIAKGIDFNIVKEASKIKSVQKQDGERDSKAITNSAAALVRKFYEEKGVYQKIVDYCNSSKDTDVTAFGLSTKVLDDATYKNILSEIAKVRKGK